MPFQITSSQNPCDLDFDLYVKNSFFGLLKLLPVGAILFLSILILNVFVLSLHALKYLYPEIKLCRQQKNSFNKINLIISFTVDGMRREGANSGRHMSECGVYTIQGPAE